VTPIPKVALVGRPNVGKSTLFNRLCGQRKAIIDSRPGSTRDRNYAQCDWRGAAYELIDTGGLLFAEADPLSRAASDQADQAIGEANLAVLVVDGRAGLLPTDSEIARCLRRRAKRVIVAVNKSESARPAPTEFARLGFEHVLPVSAEHGLGVGELLDLVFEMLPQVAQSEPEARPLRLAIVGCPNVGKSSLMNRLLGQERSVVSEVPGTTRDAVDSLLTRGEKRYLFVDTAGFRRRGVLTRAVDSVGVLQSQQAIRRCDVSVVVVDAGDGVRDTDTQVVGRVEAAGKGIVLAVNKWDGDRVSRQKRTQLSAAVRERGKLLAHAPVVFVSALTGEGMESLLAAADEVQAARMSRVTTGRLNRLLVEAFEAQPPRSGRSGASVRLLYGTQVGTAPPTFVLAFNRRADLQESYRRYLENRIRQEFGFRGSPIVLKAKTRKH
jgi:GTP-binding protein